MRWWGRKQSKPIDVATMDLSHFPRDDRERVRAALQERFMLEAQGAPALASAIREIYDALRLWRDDVYSPEDLIPYLQMKLEVWAKMPPRDVKGPLRTREEWEEKHKKSLEAFRRMVATDSR